MLLEDKAVLVTGAGAGLGRAIALLSADEGARVLVSDVVADAVDVVVAEVRATGGTAEGFVCDVADEGAVARMVQRCADVFGGLDCAVNNAGLAPDRRPVDELDLDQFDRLVAVNLRGVAACMKHQARHFRTAGGGSIVNIGSTSSVRPQPGCPAYVAAKHGVVGLTKTGAVDLAAYAVRVNAVLPGGMDTAMIRASRAAAGDDVPTGESRLSLFNRLADPTEVAQAAVWLSSDRASYVTGAQLAVDSGYLAR